VATRRRAEPYPWEIPVLEKILLRRRICADISIPAYPDFEVCLSGPAARGEFLNEFAGFHGFAQGWQRCDAAIRMLRCDDHTAGGKKSKRGLSSVADNDLAVGRVVEAVSNRHIGTTRPSWFLRMTRRTGRTRGFAPQHRAGDQ